jgi:hypothetical protein
MEKKMKLSLGGNELVLNFDTPRHWTLFKKATGFDILTFGNTEIDADRIVQFAKGLTYAGYYAECKLNKVDPKFTMEEIFDLVDDGRKEFPTELIVFYQSSQQTEELGEQNGQLNQSVLTN